jgi:transposase
MPDRKLRIIRVDCALIAAGLCAVTPFTVLAQDDLFAELRRCSLIDDGPARLECYDALSGRRSPAAGEVRQEAAAEPDQKKFDQTATGVTTSGQARVGEGLLDGHGVLAMTPRSSKYGQRCPDVRKMSARNTFSISRMARSGSKRATRNCISKSAISM